MQHPTLQSYLKIHVTLSEHVALKVLSQLVDAVQHTHSKGISHHDIKPENVSFDPSTYNIKLFDFGLAIHIGLDPESRLTTWDAGSPLYMAPEVLLTDSHNPFVSDVWSLGILLYEVIVGKTPFHQCKTIEELGKLWTSGKFSLLIPDDVHCSSSLRQLCKRMLAYNPQNRISIPELRQSLKAHNQPVTAMLRNLSPFKKSENISSKFSSPLFGTVIPEGEEFAISSNVKMKRRRSFSLQSPTGIFNSLSKLTPNKAMITLVGSSADIN